MTQFTVKKLSEPLAAGDRIYYGEYVLGTENVKEPVPWRILAKEDDRIFVISEFGLEVREYNHKWALMTWEKCDLRAWLNGPFYEETFSEEEKKAIETVTVTADQNPGFETDPGNDVQDKIYLLSIIEAGKYFSGNEDRRCFPTPHCASKTVRDEDGCCWWWLRSQGYIFYHAANISPAGEINDAGNNNNYGTRTARPVMWVRLPREKDE